MQCVVELGSICIETTEKASLLLGGMLVFVIVAILILSNDD